MLMFHKKSMLCILAISSLSITGCSMLGVGEDEFACKGIPEGVTCLPAREVYKLTENRDGLEGYTNEEYLEKKSQLADDEKDSDGNVENGDTNSNNGLVLGNVKIYNHIQPEKYIDARAPAPLAMRTRVKSMRIWIAPWEDKAGDLNLSGYIYTEIEGRRWLLGETAVTEPGRIVPLQVVRRKEGESAKNAPKTNFNPLSASKKGR